MYICSIYVCICILNIIYEISGPFSETSPSTLPALFSQAVEAPEALDRR